MEGHADLLSEPCSSARATSKAPVLLFQEFWPSDIQERLCPCKTVRVSQILQQPLCAASDSRKMLFFK